MVRKLDKIELTNKIKYSVLEIDKCVQFEVLLYYTSILQDIIL